IAVKTQGYENRIAGMLELYEEYRLMVDEMAEIDVEAKANTIKGKTEKEDKPKNAETAEKIRKRTQKVIDKLEGYDLSLITKVYTQFTPRNDFTPAQELFADLSYLKAKVIDKKFMKGLQNQLDTYRGYQALALAMLLDAQKATNDVGARITEK